MRSRPFLLHLSDPEEPEGLVRSVKRNGEEAVRKKSGAARTFTFSTCRGNELSCQTVLMPDGYYPDHYDQPDDQLDEFLCEYVDGTMDAAVRKAFEEFLEANPSLAAHADCLCRTRSMLCSYGGRHGRASLEAQIRHRVAFELERKNRVEATYISRLGRAAIATSFVSLFLIVGMMTGLSSVESSTPVQLAATGQMELQDSMALPSENPHGVGSVPLEQSIKQPRWSVMGTASVLPAIDMSPIGFQQASMDDSPFYLAVAP